MGLFVSKAVILDLSNVTSIKAICGTPLFETAFKFQSIIIPNIYNCVPNTCECAFSFWEPFRWCSGSHLLNKITKHHVGTLTGLPLTRSRAEFVCISENHLYKGIPGRLYDLAMSF
jgi:hypothetical protein